MIEFNHEGKDIFECLGMPPDTTGEELDAGFQKFLDTFLLRKTASERIEHLIKGIEEPEVALTVYHMVMHCLGQMQQAERNAKALEEMNSRIIQPKGNIILPN